MSTASTDPFAPFGKATPEEIQRAHDLLHAIACGDVDAPMHQENRRLVQATHDALAWVLGFEGGDTFRMMLSAMLRELKRNGATVWRNPPPA